MTPKQYAEQLYNKYYAIIFEYGEEMSQEVVISQLAKKCAIQSIKDQLDILLETEQYSSMGGICGIFLIRSKLYETIKELEKL